MSLYFWHTALSYREIQFIAELREQLVILMRDDGFSFRAIAAEFEISTSRARQIYMKREYRLRAEAERALERERWKRLD